MQELVTLKDEVIIDSYSLVIGGAMPVIILVYYMTFIHVNPDFAQVAIIGLGIMTAGVAFGGMLGAAPEIFGKVRLEFNPLPVSEAADVGLKIIVLGMVSIILQILTMLSEPQAGVTLMGAKPHAVVTVTGGTVGNAWDTLFLIEGMASAEEWFFRFFLYRLTRGISAGMLPASWAPQLRRWVGIIIATLLTSAIFGYIYHQVVYNNDFFLMTTAFFGSIVYCLGMQFTRRLSVPQVLHGAQDFIASIPSLTSAALLMVPGAIGRFGRLFDPILSRAKQDL
jgi:membrane protease YdiL (CAAX protease family)